MRIYWTHTQMFKNRQARGAKRCCMGQMGESLIGCHGYNLVSINVRMNFQIELMILL